MVRNYLFCGPKIIERLQEKVPEFSEVLSAADLATVESDDPVTPNAYVVYNGDITGTSPSATGKLEAGAVYQPVMDSDDLRLSARFSWFR